MIQFRLSNRQRHELLVRAVPLAIALPAPWACEHLDAMDWCRRVLGADGRWIVRVELTDVLVRPSPGTDGLTGILGAILPDGDPGPDVLAWWVSAYWVDLDPPDQPRGERRPLQWPARCDEPDGVTWGVVQADREPKS